MASGCFLADSVQGRAAAAAQQQRAPASRVCAAPPRAAPRRLPRTLSSSSGRERPRVARRLALRRQPPRLCFDGRRPRAPPRDRHASASRRASSRLRAIGKISVWAALLRLGWAWTAFFPGWTAFCRAGTLFAPARRARARARARRAFAPLLAFSSPRRPPSLCRRARPPAASNCRRLSFVARRRLFAIGWSVVFFWSER